MENTPYHIPALLPQTIDALQVRPGGIYVDCTLGGGGHSRAIAEALEGSGALYSLDRDSEAVQRAVATDVFTPVHGDFRYLANYMRFFGALGRVDGVLADLGVSFHHFDDASRGFSFRADAPLDMRMSRQSSLTAADLLATASEERLASIFKLYGELRQAKRLAAAIVKARSTKAVDTTARLVELATPMLSPANLKQELAQLFQALRIEVNGEMNALEALLQASLKVLRPGGRLAVITYHSLEDRMVKNFMRTGRTDGSRPETDIYGRFEVPVEPLFSKPIVPDAAEVERNPRSRSAKLRVGVRTDVEITD